MKCIYIRIYVRTKFNIRIYNTHISHKYYDNDTKTHTHTFIIYNTNIHMYIYIYLYIHHIFLCIPVSNI